MIAASEEGEVAADRIGIDAVAVPGKVEILLVGELLPPPLHVVADKDEDDARARAALLLGGEVSFRVIERRVWARACLRKVDSPR